MGITHVRIHPDGVALQVAAGSGHWARKHPHLAAFLAGDMSENSGVEAVNDDLLATAVEADEAERQLHDFGLKLCYDMGYHKLVPHPDSLPKGEVFLPSEIVNRYY